jgi:hypothetical protein
LPPHMTRYISDFEQFILEYTRSIVVSTRK